MVRSAVTGGPVVVARGQTARGELVLRRDDGHFEVISNGVFLMDTRDGRSERLLVSAALARQPDPESVLIGGLGVGCSLRAALADPRVRRVTVVEIEPVLLDWHATHLHPFSGGALSDPRVDVVLTDLVDHLRDHPAAYQVVCLDVDNGPGWTVTDANTRLYDDAGTRLVVAAARPAGVVSVWSASASPEYEHRLRNHLHDVEVLESPVARGAPDIIYLGRRDGTGPADRAS